MKYFKYLALTAAIIALSSCGAQKRLTYIQDMEPGIDYPVADRPAVTVMKGDKLGIVVQQPGPRRPFQYGKWYLVCERQLGRCVIFRNIGLCQGISCG